MKKTTKKRAAPQVETKAEYTISLTLGDLQYHGQGASMLEALQTLPKPPKMFLKGIVRISNGVKTRELVYTPTEVKRLFYPIAQKFMAKRFSYGL